MFDEKAEENVEPEDGSEGRDISISAQEVDTPDSKPVDSLTTVGAFREATDDSAEATPVDGLDSNPQIRQDVNGSNLPNFAESSNGNSNGVLV